MTWTPDGKTIPPNVIDFVSWAKGRRICRSSWDTYSYIKVHSMSLDTKVKFKSFHRGVSSGFIGSDLEWRFRDWEEYKGKPEMPLTEQPPIGLKPPEIVRHFRIIDILDAIKRYVQSDYPISMEWVEELHSLMDLENDYRQLRQAHRGDNVKEAK